MNKRTPGPWQVEGEQIVGHDDDGLPVTVVYEMNTNEADAKLIAAAPGLLNAVRFLLSNPRNRISDADVSAANAAIDKATA